MRYLQRELIADCGAGVILWPGKAIRKLTVNCPVFTAFLGSIPHVPATHHFRAIYSTGEPFTGFRVRTRVVFEQHLGEG
jgi:hypothetical protein